VMVDARTVIGAICCVYFSDLALLVWWQEEHV